MKNTMSKDALIDFLASKSFVHMSDGINQVFYHSTLKIVVTVSPIGNILSGVSARGSMGASDFDIPSAFFERMLEVFEREAEQRHG